MTRAWLGRTASSCTVRVRVKGRVRARARVMVRSIAKVGAIVDS